MLLALVALVTSLLTATCQAGAENGYIWVVKPGSEECFYETIGKGQHFQIEYIVCRDFVANV